MGRRGQRRRRPFRIGRRNPGQVALNPTDFKHIDVVAPSGAIIGCDYAGRVARVGAEVRGVWAVGDRVAGLIHGGLFPDRGSFAEYLRIPADLTWKIPDAVSDQEAATYGVSAVTAMLALNTRLEVPWLDGGIGGRRDTPILVYSGSTSAGLYAIQIAKKAGLKVITTASPRSFELIKQYGADDVFDYHSPAAADEIRAKYPTIDRALDCFSEGKSTEFCVKAMEGDDAKVVVLLDIGKTSLHGAKVEFILTYTVFNRPFQWLPPLGPKFAARPADCDALVRFYADLPTLCTTLKPPPLEEIQPGWDNLLQSLDRLRQGRVSGSKLVANLP